MIDIKTLTLREAQEGLRNGTYTSVDLVHACFRVIEADDHRINAFISTQKEAALDAARQADERIAAGNAAPLTGIPYGVKDAICTAGVRSTGSAKILDQYIPPHHATVLARLDEQDAVMIGKQNCDAFGHGASNENSMYGPVRNPHDETKVAGGSSGGSAAAVAAGMCLFSIAEDTGGSVRQPAAFCGVAGLRASYGRNSRFGAMPMASSLDTIGPMAKTVYGVAAVMEVIAGQDPRDATTVPDPVPAYTDLLDCDVSSLKIGIPKEYMEQEGLDPQVRRAVEQRIAAFEAQGATIVPVSLPHTKYAIAAYYIIVPSEDSSNLARLDGIRYGTHGTGESLEAVYAHARAEGFPEEVKRRIMVGTYALSAGYYDAYYKKAQRVRTKIIQDFTQAFEQVDVLLTPTSPYGAFTIGEKADDPLAMYLADVFVGPAALAGLPALSVPAGVSDAGLPIGLQIIGPRLAEARVLAVGAAAMA
jgi:aspartyl-tRNA(Asn)/glutamyl-tRNA(Gln) amidotransferase subunit A